jgi:hypothetical protein
VKAVTAASLAMQGRRHHFVPLDACIETMRQTGIDMNEKYKETSLGGLAVQGYFRAMSLNLIKLCVGCDSVEDLEEWIAFRLDERRPAGEPVEQWHTTRMVPTRIAELTDGGSLYWVIKGSVQCRQRLLDIRPFTDGEGISRCHLVLEPIVARTAWQPRRAFQGWRYLKVEDAPVDLGRRRAGEIEMPPKLKRELADLGLL